ncbi:hypothetical protein SELMODRAFT_82644 [Selaginella moellendorffii]|uniref:Ubiquitin receptor RAD23 n=1 Tax=Selaginella moellendorffii TaxID=88036 RepID=D8R1C4_SELML|nr:hypothetical protein SELMODRAFT_82644 [Selaginella moellendorffii]
MKISVKTLKGNHFDLDVQPADTVIAVKKQIEDLQGKESFPCAQQLLIHQGKVLKDETTMDENKVSENGFLVVMLTKSRSSGIARCSSSSSSSSSSPSTSSSSGSGCYAVSKFSLLHLFWCSLSLVFLRRPPAATSDVYGQAASNLVAGTGLEQTIQQLVDMGGGSWDRDSCVRALRAAYNNPERAVEYLYSGIPDVADAPPVARAPPAAPAAATAPPTAAPTGGVPAPAATGGPNAVPLDLFPQVRTPPAGGGGNGALDFLRNNAQFQALRTMVQQNPQLLQPMLQELGRQNPQLLRLINENHVEFLRLISEAGGENPEAGDLLGQLAGAMPQSISVTPEEREAIERLEAMGFDRASVIEAFLACDKNEQLAANYLLEHSGDYED